LTGDRALAEIFRSAEQDDPVEVERFTKLSPARKRARATMFRHAYLAAYGARVCLNAVHWQGKDPREEKAAMEALHVAINRLASIPAMNRSEYQQKRSAIGRVSLQGDGDRSDAYRLSLADDADFLGIDPKLTPLHNSSNCGES
jgi:hypothetical protein